MGTTFIDALLAVGAAADGADRMGLYDWLVGSWQTRAVMHMDDGEQHRVEGQIHGAWILQGRAIQDVWILPGFFHGTTLRVYEPGRDAWHIFWADPLRQYYSRQIGRARGADIVQEGSNDRGEATRWSFTEVGPRSFRWLGERSLDNGGTWQLQADIQADRVTD